MSPLVKKIKKISGRFDALSTRERVMVLVAGVVVLYMVWEQLIWLPQQDQKKHIAGLLENARSEVNLLNVEMGGVLRQAKADPNIALNRDLENARLGLKQLEQRIAGITDTLVEPKEMVRLLEELMLKNGSLELVSLRTLKSEPMIKPATADQEDSKQVVKEPDAQQNIFRHGFVVEFEGDYLSVLSYLKTLEALPWHFFWDGVELNVVEYPLIQVKLKLHTLSLSEGWVGV